MYSDRKKYLNTFFQTEIVHQKCKIRYGLSIFTKQNDEQRSRH